MSEMSLSYKDVYINVLEYMEIMDTTPFRAISVGDTNYQSLFWKPKGVVHAPTLNIGQTLIVIFCIFTDTKCKYGKVYLNHASYTSEVLPLKYARFSLMIFN